MSTISTGQQATVSVDVGAAELRFETGKLAKQADGAVVVRSGDTMILATAVGRHGHAPDADFFPLTVDVEERMYAAGKIPGGFFKREGRATERATLTARMIDRPIRPLWPKGFKNEVQVICTVLSADMVVPHDILAINGASAALAISSLPFLGPVGAVRVARIEDELVVNPTFQQMEESSLDLIVVGDAEAPTMIEAGGDQVPEETPARGVRARALEVIRICDAIDELAREVGKPKWIDVELNADLDGPSGRVARRIAEHGFREAGSITDELLADEAPRSRWTRARTTSSWSSRCATPSRCCSSRSASRSSRARPGTVRDDAARVTRRGAGLEGLKWRKRDILSPDHPGSSAPVPVAEGVEPAKDVRIRAARQEGGRRDLQGHRPQEDRGHDFRKGSAVAATPLFGLPAARRGDAVPAARRRAVRTRSAGMPTMRPGGRPAQLVTALEAQLAAMAERLDNIYAAAKDLIAVDDLDVALARIPSARRPRSARPSTCWPSGPPTAVSVPTTAASTTRTSTPPRDLLAAGRPAPTRRLVAEVASMTRRHGRLMAVSPPGVLPARARAARDLRQLRAAVLDTATALEDSRRQHAGTRAAGAVPGGRRGRPQRRGRPEARGGGAVVVDCDRVMTFLWSADHAPSPARR